MTTEYIQRIEEILREVEMAKNMEYSRHAMHTLIVTKLIDLKIDMEEALPLPQKED